MGTNGGYATGDGGEVLTRTEPRGRGATPTPRVVCLHTPKETGPHPLLSGGTTVV
jgi:hypothetical protein